MTRLTQTLLLSLATMLATVSPFAIAADPVWVDVRSKFEHALDAIDGDMRVDYDNVVTAMQASYPDKTTEINLYCLSGGRAEWAKEALEEAGYTQVNNAGGIGDARRLRQLSE